METNREITEPQDQPTGDVKIAAPDVDEDVDDEGGDVAETPPGQAATDQQGAPRRQAKAGGRAERRQLWKSNQDLKAELAGTRGQITEMKSSFEREMAAIRAGITGQQRQQAAAPAGPSPVEQQLNTIYAAKAAEMKAAAAHDPRTGAYDFSKYNALDRQARKLENRQDLEEFYRERGVDPNSRAQPQRQQDPREIAQQVQLQTMANTVRAEYPWLRQEGEQGERGRAAMGAMVDFLIRAGRPNTLETHREAGARVERELGLSPRRSGASPGQERRYTSVDDINRGAPAGARQREVSVPAEMLEGSGLPMDKIRRAIFRE